MSDLHEARRTEDAVVGFYLALLQAIGDQLTEQLLKAAEVHS